MDGGILVCLFLGAVAMVQPCLAVDAPAMVVGRVYHIEGDLLRYVPEEKDWVTVVRMHPSVQRILSFQEAVGWRS